MKVQTDYGSFELVGYESVSVHYPINAKPMEGFAYVRQSDDKNDIGAIPRSEIINWDELPTRVELAQSLLDTRESMPSYKAKKK